MTKGESQEKLFLEEIDRFDAVARSMEKDLAKLDLWRADLSAKLSVKPRPIAGLKAESALAGQVAALHEGVSRALAGWSKSWEDRGPMRQLSESFGDKAALLVFGKVNAGKSSFCNFLTERFAAHGRRIRRFHLAHNAMQDSEDAFAVGVTETTSRIQGVWLGEKLVLLDTPGLHSVTPENGELTKRFTDSADAVLWLTSSGSPAQVQELDELRDELKSCKPLQPVITKSDVEEEDQVGEELIRTLRNKTAENRALQEGDVKSRALEKLAESGLKADLLCAPISVSAYAVRKGVGGAAALEEAGFERLFEALRGIARKARIYKQGKAAQMTLNHLEKDVLGALRATILPQIAHCRDAAQRAEAKLRKRAPQISAEILGEALDELPRLLERHKTTRDPQAMRQELVAFCEQTIQTQLHEELQDYSAGMNSALLQMTAADQVGFEERTTKIEVVVGSGERAAAQGMGMAGGAAMGFALGGPIGAAFGGFVGGLCGLFAGRNVETRTQEVSLGVSYERLHAALGKELRKTLPQAVEDLTAQCAASLRGVVDEAERLEAIVLNAQRDLEDLKSEFSGESARAA